jgi:hypothetical protein
MSAALRMLLLMAAAAQGAGAVAADATRAPARNPFKRPAYMIAAHAPTGGPAVPLELRLRATLVTRGSRLANIGGEMLTVGQAYAGYEIAEIQEGRAVLVKDGQRTVLEVYEPRTASNARHR